MQYLLGCWHFMIAKWLNLNSCWFKTGLEFLTLFYLITVVVCFDFWPTISLPYLWLVSLDILRFEKKSKTRHSSLVFVLAINNSSLCWMSTYLNLRKNNSGRNGCENLLTTFMSICRFSTKKTRNTSPRW